LEQKHQKLVVKSEINEIAKELNIDELNPA